MNSLSLQLLSALSPCIGRGGPANVTGRVKGRTFNLALGSTQPAAFLATNGYDSGARVLGAGLNETLDVRNFTNIVNETAQALSKVRLFYVLHAPTSLASQISVGNSGANTFAPYNLFGSTPFPLPKNGLVIVGVPSAAGILADATHKDLKVTNDDLTNAATYYAGWWGE